MQGFPQFVRQRGREKMMGPSRHAGFRPAATDDGMPLRCLLFFVGRHPGFEPFQGH